MRPWTVWRCWLALGALLACLVATDGRAQAEAPAEPPTPFRSAFGEGDIDWENTVETPPNPEVKGFAQSREDQILRCLGVRQPGASHGNWYPGPLPPDLPADQRPPQCCRLAFKQPVTLGTIIQGAWLRHFDGYFPPTTIALLKADAPYPGDLANDDHWQPLTPLAPQRGAKVYVLPPGTTTRALRLGGGVSAYRFWAGRLNDLTQSAVCVASGGDPRSIPAGQFWSVTAPADISAQNPQWIIYSWPEPQTVRGVAFFLAVFRHFQVATYRGAATTDPLSAPEEAWKVLSEGDVQPRWRWAHDNYVDFGKDLTTTAIRLAITQPFVAENPDLADWTKRTARVAALTGFLALQDLREAAVPAAVAPVAAAGPESHPPIPIRFTLDQPGSVTLVLEDPAGKRVRNLVSDTLYPAGENVFWFDGLDEHRYQTIHISGVALYTQIRGNLLTPGPYRVRGLVRGPLELRYEFPVYSGDNLPAWHNADRSGAWLADHTPPSAVLYLPPRDKEEPRVLIGSAVAEAGEGLVWVDLEGKRRYGVRGIGGGGGWWGGEFLARDAGPQALPGIYAYNGGAWKDVLELWAMGPNKLLLTHKFPDEKTGGMGGLAARNGLLVTSLSGANQLLFADARTGKELGVVALERPRGLAFDRDGRLLALSGQRLLRFALPAPPVAAGAAPVLPEPTVLCNVGLEDPQGLTLDDDNNIYVSDWGQWNQIRVFTADGILTRTIGHGGEQRVGPYDPQHMNRPKGLTITPDGHLWVAECHAVPKRTSVWKLDGTFVKAMYGPHWYGGGGALDPRDPSRFYIAQAGGMEFKLDWATGTSQLTNIYYLPGQTGVALPGGLGWSASPQTPVYVGDRLYLSNCFASHPTNGEDVVGIWQMRDGLAVPVAAAGRAAAWSLLAGEAFLPRLPGEVALNDAIFVWSDRNDDAQVQPDEVTFARGVAGCVTLHRDLSLTTSPALHLVPQGFSPKGAPLYDLTAAKTLVPGARPPGTSGGGQVIAGRDGWTVLTWPPEPYPGSGSLLVGAQNGQLRWDYPVEFMGLHNSASSPVPPYPGYVLGTTRLLGPTITPPGTQEEIWAINGNMGVVYLFTTDGLHVATLFRDCRGAPAWPATAERNALLNHLSLGQECFFPSITQLDNGKIYLVVGQPTSLIVRLDGLEKTKRLPAFDLPLSAEQLAAAAAWFGQREADRIHAAGAKTLTVSIREAAPTVDGTLTDWPDPYFVTLDATAAAAVAVSGDRLYAAYRTGDANLLTNAGGLWQQLFKTGGALDLMLGTDPQADANRTAPVAGDLRLLVAVVGGKPQAVLYRAVVPGTAEPVVFRSWHTLTLDQVTDVSADLQLAGANGNYEFSIPLATLGLKPAGGQQLRGDVGILRGNGTQTTQRLYWQNQATGIVSDVPTEAALQPQLWGRWRFLAPFPRPTGKPVYDPAVAPTPNELKPALGRLGQWIQRRYQDEGKLATRLSAKPGAGRCFAYIEVTPEFLAKNLNFRREFIQIAWELWANECVARELVLGRKYAHLVLVDSTRKIVGGLDQEGATPRWLDEPPPAP